MTNKISKIHILGGPGAGKTYLSKKLSKKLHIKSYNLDKIVWDKKSHYFDKQIPKKQRDKKLANILKNESWIIEGVYYEWLLKSFRKADLIIILKPHVFLRNLQIIKRFILKKLGFIKTKKERLKDLISLLKWNHYYERVRINETLKITEPFKKKRLFFKNAKQTLKYIIKNFSEV